MVKLLLHIIILYNHLILEKKIEINPTYDIMTDINAQNVYK